MKRRAAIAILAVAMGVNTARAGDEGGGQSPLVLGVGAREQAMGRTGAALSLGSDALFWNPARLGIIDVPEVSLYHSKLFVDGIAYRATFATYPTLDFGTFAVGYQRIGISDVELRDDRNQLLGSFDSAESNLLLGYGRNVSSTLSVGGALRIAQQSVAEESDSGIGLDLAISHERTFGTRHRVAAGANLQNAIEPKLRLDTDEVPEPRSLKLGGAYTASFTELTLVSAVDADLTSARNARVGLGVEATYRNMLSVRGGVDDGNPTFGVGIGYQFVRFDYALREDPDLPRTDRFSLLLRLGRSRSERLVARGAEREAAVAETLSRRLKEQEAEALQQARQQADAAYATRDLEAALRLYRRVLLLAPADEQARQRTAAIEMDLSVAQAAALLETGRAVEAAAAYTRILAQDSTDARALDGLALARGQLQQAADREQQLNALFKHGLDAFANDDFAAAEVSLNELLLLDATHELGLELIERVRATRRTHGNEALASARAAAASREYATALKKLADARRLLGTSTEIAGLETDWKRAEREAIAARELAAAATPREDTSPALPAAPPVRRRFTEAERRQMEAKYQEGLQAFAGGDFQRAIRNWHSIWIDDPGYESVAEHLIKAYLFEGVELYGRGEYDAALDRCRRVLEIDPRNEKARRYVGRIQEEQQELEEIGGDGQD